MTSLTVNVFGCDENASRTVEFFADKAGVSAVSDAKTARVLLGVAASCEAALVAWDSGGRSQGLVLVGPNDDSVLKAFKSPPASSTPWGQPRPVVFVDCTFKCAAWRRYLIMSSVADCAQDCVDHNLVDVRSLLPEMVRIASGDLSWLGMSAPSVAPPPKKTQASLFLAATQKKRKVDATVS